MAADRGNPRVAHLCDPSDTAMRRSVAMTLAAARSAGIEAGMCGELAADPEATAWLLEAGLEEFQRQRTRRRAAQRADTDAEPA